MPVPQRPFSLNHYDFLNQLLDIEDDELLKRNSDRQRIQNILNMARDKIEEIERNRRNTTPEQRTAITKKFERIRADFENAEKKTRYDNALSGNPALTEAITVRDGKTEVKAAALAPISEITTAFNDFKARYPGQAAGFTYEAGPPAVYNFPDDAKRDEFLQILFERNLVMMPNGSQDIQDVKNAHANLRQPPRNEPAREAHFNAQQAAQANQPANPNPQAGLANQPANPNPQVVPVQDPDEAPEFDLFAPDWEAGIQQGANQPVGQNAPQDPVGQVQVPDVRQVPANAQPVEQIKEVQEEEADEGFNDGLTELSNSAKDTFNELKDRLFTNTDSKNNSKKTKSEEPPKSATDFHNGL